MNQPTFRRIGALFGVILGIVYLLNPTAGILELIPDNAPLIGNLDEASATALVIWGIQQMRTGAALALPAARGRR